MARYFNFDEPFEIRIDKDGKWYHNGREITHPGVFRYLNSVLDVDEKGYFLRDGERKFYIEVEDAPFVVNSLVECDGKICVLLNDGTQEELDPESLTFRDEVVYAKVKNGKFPARFSRKAQNQLYQMIEEDNGNFYLSINGKRVRLEV